MLGKQKEPNIKDYILKKNTIWSQKFDFQFAFLQKCWFCFYCEQKKIAHFELLVHLIYVFLEEEKYWGCYHHVLPIHHFFQDFLVYQTKKLKKQKHCKIVKLYVA